MKFNNFINLNDNKNLENKNTILTVMLLGYLFIASNSTSRLFSGQLTDFINDNRAAQHFIGFITIAILISYLGNLTKFVNIMLYSVVIYSWFLLTTKLDLGWNILIIGMLIVYYFIQNDINNKENITHDPFVNRNIKKAIINKNNSKKTYIFWTILSLTILGSGLYLGKKYKQYGDNFDINKFILGEKN